MRVLKSTYMKVTEVWVGQLLTLQGVEEAELELHVAVVEVQVVLSLLAHHLNGHSRRTSRHASGRATG